MGGLNEEEQAKAWSGLEKVFGKVAPGQRPAGALVRVAHLLHLKDAKKLVEEVGEICRAVLKDNHRDVVDGIGDAVVVLTNLAELQGTSIEHCIAEAYNEIKDRTGKMDNGTFKKD